MSRNISFHEPAPARQRSRRREQPKLIRWVLKTGIVQTQKQAEYTLLGIAIVAAILTGYLLLAGIGGTEPAAGDVPPGEIVPR